MRKRFSIIAMCIGILIMVSGCGGGKKPGTTVSEFIEAMKVLDLEKMSSKTIGDQIKDKEEMELFSDVDQDDPMEQYMIEYLGSNAKKISYKIKEEEIDGDTATVHVDIEYVDGGPLFQKTFAEFMQQSIGLLFQGQELTDEESSELYIKIMKEQEEITEQALVEKSLEFKCIKKDKEWFIQELDDEILNIIMSNILSVMDGIDDAMEFDDLGDDLDQDLDEDHEVEEDVTVIEIGTGEEIELATLKMKINSFEEVQMIPSKYGDDLEAKEGTKFLLVNMDLTNITKSELDGPASFPLIDSEEREYQSYGGIGVVDDYLEYRGLAPSIKETGTYIYELPEDSVNCYITVKHADTGEVYRIYLD